MLSTISLLVLLAASFQHYVESALYTAPVTLIDIEPPNPIVFNSSKGILKHVKTLKIEKGGWAARQVSMIFSEDGFQMVGGISHMHYYWMANPFSVGGSSTPISINWLPDPEDIYGRSLFTALGYIERLIISGEYQGGLQGEFYALYENSDIIKYSHGLQGGVGVHIGVHAINLSDRCKYLRTILKLRATPDSGDGGLLLIFCQHSLPEDEIIEVFAYNESDFNVRMSDVAQLRSGDVMILSERDRVGKKPGMEISYINIESIREAIPHNGLVTPTVIFKLDDGNRYLGDTVERLAVHEDWNTIFVYVLGKNYKERIEEDAYYSKFHWAPNTSDPSYKPPSVAIRPGFRTTHASTVLSLVIIFGLLHPLLLG
ncbi:hypothetical protein FOL47_009868 [Perkinsus chesapeaki]|uniref:Uncharacterized protein n=1 Tax=Perkinsus chesapeaki TaxID=330153 RepID=A0A7J6L5X0_PERCH|nr:hypothetical protein FOL47_009868 [Perkinsus chesapeaki]